MELRILFNFVDGTIRQWKLKAHISHGQSEKCSRAWKFYVRSKEFENFEEVSRFQNENKYLNIFREDSKANLARFFEQNVFPFFEPD